MEIEIWIQEIAMKFVKITNEACNIAAISLKLNNT